MHTKFGQNWQSHFRDVSKMNFPYIYKHFVTTWTLNPKCIICSLTNHLTVCNVESKCRYTGLEISILFICRFLKKSLSYFQVFVPTCASYVYQFTSLFLGIIRRYLQTIVILFIVSRNKVGAIFILYNVGTYFSFLFMHTDKKNAGYLISHHCNWLESN